MSRSSVSPESAFKKSRLLCCGLLLASGIIYGSSFSFMKIAAVAGANPLGMVFWFSITAAGVFVMELALFRRLSRLELRYLRFCLPWSVLGVILPNLFFFHAAGEIQASLIAVAIALVPILTLSGAILLRRDELTWGRAAGIGLGATAVMMILLPETSLPEVDDTFAVLIAFAGAACYAAEHLYIAVRAPSVGIDVLLLLMFLAASILLLPVVLITGTFIVPSWPFGKAEWAILGVTAVTMIDYFFYTLLIRWAGPVFTSQAAYIVTLAGVIWGIVIFGDSHSLWVWGAIGILMVGLTLVRPRHAAGQRL